MPCDATAKAAVTLLVLAFKWLWIFTLAVNHSKGRRLNRQWVRRGGDDQWITIVIGIAGNALDAEHPNLSSRQHAYQPALESSDFPLYGLRRTHLEPTQGLKDGQP